LNYNKLQAVTRNKKVVGVGINDAPYPVLRRDGDKKYTCPKYAMWCRMLARCYDSLTHTRQPTYVGCLVCDEWLLFSNFLSWLESQDWQNKQLDKDLLRRDNRLYSPDFCCFLTHRVNTFLKDNGNTRGDQPLWVTYKSHKGLYAANVSDPLQRYSNYIGSYRCPIKAHKAAKAKKHEYAVELAEFETDLQVKTALITRYSDDTNWLNG